MTDAKKERFTKKQILELARSAKKILVSRGKNVITLEVKGGVPSDEEILKHLLGPSGNLRAPTIRYRGNLLVGFNPGAYREELG